MSSEKPYAPSNAERKALENFLRSLLTPGEDINFGLLDTVSLAGLQWFTAQYARQLDADVVTPATREQAFKLLRDQIDHASDTDGKYISHAESYQLKRRGEEYPNDIIARGHGERQFEFQEVSGHISRAKVHFYRRMTGWQALTSYMLSNSKNPSSGGGAIDDLIDFLNKKGMEYAVKYKGNDITAEEWIRRNYYSRDSVSRGDKPRYVTVLSPQAQEDVKVLFKDLEPKGAIKAVMERPGWKSTDNVKTLRTKKYREHIVPLIEQKAESLAQNYATDNNVSIEVGRRYISETYYWSHPNHVLRMFSEEAQQDVESFKVQLEDKFKAIPRSYKREAPYDGWVLRNSLPIPLHYSKIIAKFLAQRRMSLIEEYMQNHSVPLSLAEQHVNQTYVVRSSNDDNGYLWLSPQAQEDAKKYYESLLVKKSEEKKSNWKFMRNIDVGIYREKRVKEYILDQIEARIDKHMEEHGSTVEEALAYVNNNYARLTLMGNKTHLLLSPEAQEDALEFNKTLPTRRRKMLDDSTGMGR